MFHKRQLAYAPWLLAPAVIALGFLVIPLFAVAWRTPWSDFGALISAPDSRDALWLSVRTCLVSTTVTAVIGVPLAFVLAKTDRWWARAMRLLVLLPMVLPPVVTGLALLLTWGRMGLLGHYLEFAGIEISFSTVAVIFSQVFVAMPFLVMSFESAVRAAGDSYEVTARSLGASRTRTFFGVSLPVLFPALISAVALAFSRALGEFGATMTFAGSLQGVTRTMPLQIYLQREMDTDQALALAVVLIALAGVMLGIASVSVVPWAWFGKFRREVRIDNDVLLPTRRVHAPRISVNADVAERNVAIRAQIPAGSVVAVMGANGSGKSTLLGLISGTIPASTGTVSFSPASPRIVTLLQSPLLFPHLNVVENVEFGLRCAGYSRAAARRQALSELALVGMADHAYAAATKLSGGQGQRVALARAMAISPDVVLLDEPFAALDETTTDALRIQLRERLTQAGVTAVIVTHDIVDATDMADSILTLRHGKVISHSPVARQ